MKIRGITAALALMLVTGGATATSYITVQDSAAGVKGDTLDVTAHCPAGYTPVGGGYDMYPGAYTFTYVSFLHAVPPNQYIDQSSTKTEFLPRVVVTISRPNDAGDGWRTAGFLNESLTLYAWARCASLN